MIVDDRTDIARRMEAIAIAGNAVDQGHPDLPNDPWVPRYAMDAKWVTFECGCVAERCMVLFAPQPFEPVIFQGTRQQAVYSEVCHRHYPGMNKRLGMGSAGLTFERWKRDRRALLMGRVRP